VPGGNMTMKKVLFPVLAAWALGWAAGCDSGGGEAKGTPGTAGLDLTGSWSGEYTSPGVRIALKAKIRQNGDAVVIQTSKDGVCNLLTGTMSPDGSLFMTDSVDAETWTSHGEVTESGFLVRDYLYDPSLGSDSPEQDLILRR
jgi:hypothetical protein